MELQHLLQGSAAPLSHPSSNELEFHLPLTRQLSIDVLHWRQSSQVGWRHWESAHSLSLYFYNGENNTFDLELSQSVETVQTLENSRISYYTLSGAYHLNSQLALRSEAGLSSSLDRWAGAQQHTPSISFSLSYSAAEDSLVFTGFASYARSRGANTNDRTIDGGAGLIWTPADSLFKGTTFYLDVIYSDYRDAISTENSYDDVSIELSWELFSF